MHIPNAELPGGQAMPYKSPGMWIAGGRRRTLSARRTFQRHPLSLAAPSAFQACLRSVVGITLQGKRGSTVLQCDTTGEVAMTAKHAARNLAPIQHLTLHSVDLLRDADHLNTQKTRRLHHITSQSTRDTANPGPKRTHATRETSTA
jgi:hypothetical protein